VARFWSSIAFFRYQIRIGDWNHKSIHDDSNLLILNVIAIFKHPEYTEGAIYFDSAVLETEEITFSKSRTPVCLPR
jgi:hypothetical protein